MTTDSIALELEKLRSTMVEGFGQVNVKFAEASGQLSQLVDRGQRTEADVAALTTRVTALEKRVWTASGAAALIGALVPILIQMFGGV